MGLKRALNAGVVRFRDGHVEKIISFDSDRYVDTKLCRIGFKTESGSYFYEEYFKPTKLPVRSNSSPFTSVEVGYRVYKLKTDDTGRFIGGMILFPQIVSLDFNIKKKGDE